MYYDELYHHGIKGMHWGVRRFQNYDGSYTNAGRSKYGFGKRRNSQFGASNGHSDSRRYRTSRSDRKIQKANTKQVRKLKVARNIAIGAAIAAGIGIGAIAYSKWARYNKDVIINGKTIMQRITNSSEATDKVHDMFYVAVGKHDMNRYRQLMPAHFNRQNDWHRIRGDMPGMDFDHHIVKYLKSANGKTLKIANKKNAEKIFETLRKEDADFAKAFKGKSYDDFNKIIPAIRSMDDNSNTSIKKNANKFYEAAKKKGYAGIIDMNDKKYSGFNAKKPTIIFDRNDAVVDRATKINANASADLANAWMEEHNIAQEVARRNWVDKYGATALGAVSSASIGKAATKQKQINESTNRKSKNNK